MSDPKDSQVTQPYPLTEVWIATTWAGQVRAVYCTEEEAKNHPDKTCGAKRWKIEGAKKGLVKPPQCKQTPNPKLPGIPTVDGGALAAILLDQPWHAGCEIIPDYMPPSPRKDTKPSVKVRFNNGSDHPPYLRFSQGALQGYFWDVYGDDMHSVEVAIVALSKAPAPRSVAPITVTFPSR